MRRYAILLLALLALSLATTAAIAADDAPTIRFGVPTWPGVTVKTQVAAELIQAMGYATKQVKASPAFIMSGLNNGDIGVYLGGWIPTEKNMINTAASQGQVKILAKNITGAVMGLAVPHYVWAAGVHSEADLAKHAAKFNHKIYGIEPGSGTNKDISAAIANDRDGLGDWQLVQSSASVMLSQVGRSIRQHQWIVFLGWEPHWMNIKYNFNYLKPVGHSKIAELKSDVLTVANPKVVAKYPDIARFLRQFVVTKRQQSKWIFAYSQKKRPAPKVASQWIGDHLDQVGHWLHGVKTRNGGSAIKAVRAKYNAD